MLFWLTLFGFTIVLPLVVLGIRRSFKTFMASFASMLLIAFFQNRSLCQADRMSEACTWAYLNYAYAVFAGAVLFLIASGIQYLSDRIRANSERP